MNLTGSPTQSRPPGPPPAPLLGWRGNLLAFRRDPIAYAGRLFQRYGDIVALPDGANELVLVLGPDYNQALLDEPQTFRAAIGVQAAPGSDALKSALLATLEDPRFVGAYRRVVAQTARRTCERWGIGQQIDAAWVMQRLTVRTAARALFGLERSEDIAALIEITDHWHAAGAASIVYGAPLEVPGTPFRGILGLAQRVERVLRAVYAHARAR